jgi:hypothetical protein
MDKDSVILKYLQQEAENIDVEIGEVKSRNSSIEQSLGEIDYQLDEIYSLLNMKKRNIVPAEQSNISSEESTSGISITSYDELYNKAALELVKRGLDIDSLDYHSLVSESELREIEKELNRPLPRREKWEKADFVAVFIAASIGSLVDLILSDRTNKFTGKGSAVSEWLNQMHQHDGGGPIDYQGKGFGGGFHRELSKGHDVLRFIEAIIMFKNGQFEGIRYINGVAHKVVSSVNQYGLPYEQLGWIEAILKYAQHMFADLFSTCSLPFPGSSFLVECSNRDLRKLAATMYQDGFNLKNIMIQSLSTIIVEVIIRIYFGIKSVQSYKSEYELNEDYSNFTAIKEFIRPSYKDKLYEMLLLAHSIVTAVNVGKVIIKKSPWELNITEIISVIRYSIPVVNGVIERHSEYSKLIRNADEIHGKWEQLAENISLQNMEIDLMSHELIVE